MASQNFDRFFAFLDTFPTPASITALTKEEFVTAAWYIVGRKLSKNTGSFGYLRDGAPIDRIAAAA